MTIRRINVSQIVGNNADTNDASEIRPYGEIGLYEGDYIDSLDYDRLELLIHDGKRTHLKSKVLSPGIFYGSGADSSDGGGFDTIKLIPDAALHYNSGSYGNDQYIVIDPTTPNHIHIRAGGVAGLSNAELYLGSENNHVRIVDQTNQVVISTDGGIGGDYEWAFGENGQLTFPNNTVQTTAWSGGNVRPAPASSIGSDGDRAGDIAFSNSYFYYCISDFVGQQTAESTLSQEASNTNVFYVSTNDVPNDPNGGTIQLNPGAAGPTFNIVSTQLVGFEWEITTDAGNTSAGQNTPVLITYSLPDIWKRVAWSGDTW